MSAGREDDRDLVVLHQGVGGLHGGVRHALDDAFGGAGRDRSLVQKISRVIGALRGAGVRADDDGVARLQADEAFVDDGRGGVGGGQDRGDHAHGHADFHHLLLRQLAENADRLHAADSAGEEIGVQQVFGDLVLDVAVLGFFDGHFRQHLGIRPAGGGHRLDDAVDLLLVEPLIRPEGRQGLLHLGADFLQGDEIRVA